MRAGGVLRRIGIRDFRCFAAADVELDTGINVLVGPNGAGKTSFLEAIFFVSRGRSFRTGDFNSLQRQGAEAFQVFGQIDDNGRPVPVGVERRNGQTRSRYDGEPATSAAMLAEALPVLLIDPRSHLLIEGGPAVRRQFLDWGAFHVEHRFIADWRRYQRALRQRNALLKQAASQRDLAPWDVELAASGEALDKWRRQFMDEYAPALDALVPELIDGVDVSLQYRRGWAVQASLDEALAHVLENDRVRGATSVGPHRADLAIRWNGHVAQEQVSRGQQKLLAIAMLLAQAQVYAEHRDRNCLLLVDDPVAELDSVHLQRFLHLLGRLKAQTIITCVDATPMDLTQLDEPKLFHVEQGIVREMVQ